MMAAYYNENDAFAAAWLRELIRGGQISDGDVDERDIRLVEANELRDYAQHHFFAGIGVWSHAIRKAGWPDDRPVWTGSCPCQPFSAAGKAGGVEDERHLWPDWFKLIDQCRPAIVLGEQVSSKAGLEWLDIVSADLEGAGYAIGAADLCAAGVGAPHIRQRLWFVAQWLADADYPRPQGRNIGGHGARQRAAGPGGVAGGLADADEGQRRRFAELRRVEHNGADTGRSQGDSEPEPCGEGGGLADADGRDTGAEGLQRGGQLGQHTQDGGAGRGGDRRLGDNRGPRLAGTGAADSFWADADWLLCRDGRWRPVESKSFPLVTRATGRVGKLRGYGNSLCSPVATAFVEEVMGVL